MIDFGPLNLTEEQVAPPALPFRLVGLEPSRPRKIFTRDIESWDHALFLVQEGQEQGIFVPVWIEDQNGLIIYVAEQIYADLRKRQSEGENA